MLVAALAAATTAGALAQVAPGSGSVTVSLSSSRAGARPVVVTLAVHTELQCGRLTGGTVVIRLPVAERVPAAVPAAAVLVGGKTSGGVAVQGHVLTVTVPRTTGVICDVIGPGTVQVVLGRAAGLGNPPQAGTYSLSVARGRLLLTTHFRVR